MDTPRYAVPPPLPPIAALILIVALDSLAPVPFLPRALSLAVGVPLLVLAGGVWAWAIAYMLRARESPNPGRATAGLVTGGPFGSSRNPLYTSETAALLGLALLLDTAPGVAVVLGLALVWNYLILAEERYLETKFGDQWREYASRVRRWI